MIQTGFDPVPPNLALPSPTEARKPTRLASTIKRGLDIVVSATSILLLLPLMLLVAVTVSALHLTSPIERETRLGSGGRSFQALRFRTTEPGNAAIDEPEIAVTPGAPGTVTAFGRVLGATSLDQLPMLLNVLRGEMSLVGCRPVLSATAVASDLDAYLPMPPGLTGSWQVEVGPDATEADRAALDLDYASRWSLRRDLAIMLRGVANAFARRDGR